MTTATTAVVPNKARVNLPVSYAEDMAAEAAAIAKRLAAPSGDFIKCNKDKTFGFPNGETAEVLSGVIVDFVSKNTYYPGKYDPKDIKPPTCYSIGTDLDDMKPSEKSTDKQNADCKSCWANQWGSDGRGKACKNSREIAVLATDLQADGPLMIVKIAPMGTRYFDAHVAKNTTLAGAVLKVVTDITFDQASEYQSLRFAAVGPNDNWEAAYSRKKEARARLMTEPDYGAAPAKPPAKGKGK